MAELTSNHLLKTNPSVETDISVLNCTENIQHHRALFLEVMHFPAICPSCQIVVEEFEFSPLLLTLCTDSPTDLRALLH